MFSCLIYEMMCPHSALSVLGLKMPGALRRRSSSEDSSIKTEVTLKEKKYTLNIY